MKRPLILLMGTFLALLLGYLGYYVASRQEAPAARQYELPPVHEVEKSVPVPGARAEVRPGTGLRIAVYHPRYHRLEALYTAEAWDKIGDRFLLQAPRMEWYLRSGEVITIRGRNGTVRARDLGDRWNVLEGELTGDVWIVLDAARQAVRRPLSERPADAVRIHVDQVHFDRTALLIHSDSYVSVFAHQADILGRGLRISWSMEPRQLRELKILHGEYMCIRPTTAPAERSESGAGPVPAIHGGRGLLAAGMVPAALAATTTTRAASTLPAATTASAPAALLPVVKDTYLAVLTGDVMVTSGEQYLKNADELKLVFEFKQPGQDEPAATTMSASAPTAAAATPTGGTPAAATAIRPPDTSARSAPMDMLISFPGGGWERSGRGPKADADSAAPLFVTWTGPLVVTPFRSHDEYVAGRLDVEARGAALELGGERATARCKVFEFRSTDQRGSLSGTQAEPVQLRMADGGSSRAPEIRFDRKKGVVNLDGAGEMHLPGGAGAMVADGRAEPGSAEEALDVRWAEGVEVLLGQRRISREGRDERQDFLLQATFKGTVSATQPGSQKLRAERLEVTFHRPPADAEAVNQPAELHAAGGVHLVDLPSGDFIKSERLDVEMSAPGEGEAHPKVAVARGGVSARQEQTEITTEELTVTFAAEPDEETGKLRIRPRRLEAGGGVKIVDRREKDPVTAEAETLTSDLTERSAVLVGKPASVIQKDKQMEGARIVFNQVKETATVAGSGQLRFDTKTDLSGRRLEQPRPVRMSFTKGLSYRGKERIVIVNGGVSLATSGDSVRCENMRVLFAPPEEQAEPAAGSEPLVEFRPKDIAMVLAEKKVRLASVRQDAEGFLTQRLTLWSDTGQVVYESALQKLTCLGPGTMVVEDYRPPEKRPDKPAETLVPGAEISRPSQSVFTWAKSMDLSQKDRLANLAGKVTMVHRSGSQVKPPQRAKMRPWGTLASGRNWRMDCEQMLAEFAPPAAAAGGQEGDVLSGPRVGPLELFRARAAEKGYVTVLNPPVDVVCRRIVYRRAKDVAILYGYLEGEPRRNAIVHRKDPRRGRLDVMENSEIIWRPSTNGVEARGVKVTGGR